MLYEELSKFHLSCGSVVGVMMLEGIMVIIVAYLPFWQILAQNDFN